MVGYLISHLISQGLIIRFLFLQKEASFPRNGFSHRSRPPWLDTKNKRKGNGGRNAPSHYRVCQSSSGTTAPIASGIRYITQPMPEDLTILVNIFNVRLTRANPDSQKALANQKNQAGVIPSRNPQLYCHHFGDMEALYLITPSPILTLCLHIQAKYGLELK